MNQQGFNMIELLVSISIVALISLVVWPNLRNNPNQLEFAATDMASIIRKAQTMSLSGQLYQGQTPSGGFGFRIVQCSTPPCEFRIFADLNANLVYDGATEDISTEVYHTDSQVSVSALSASPLEIVFKPPVPYICVNAECAETGEVSITLMESVNNKTKQLTINQSTGQVSIQ